MTLYTTALTCEPSRQTSLVLVPTPGGQTRPENSRPLPRYMGGHVQASEKHVQAELKRRAFALYDEFRRQLRRDPGGDSPAMRALLGELTPTSRATGPLTLDSYLWQEARRVIKLPKEQERIVHCARPLAEWALRYTSEANPRVAALFAVEWEYDNDDFYRKLTRAHLGQPRPVRWYWQVKTDRHDHGHRGWQQTFAGITTDFDPPLWFSDLRVLQEYEAPLDKCLIHGSVEEPKLPFEKQRHPRMMDCLRPPLAAVRVAAHLVERARARSALTIELGHTVAPQALSLWLAPPRPTTVDTYSVVFDGEVLPACKPGTLDAVVLGVPSLRQLKFVKMMRDSDREIDRRDVDPFWGRLWRRREPNPNPVAHVEGLVTASLGSVKVGGLLVVIGAVEAGEHHEANRRVAESGRFEPVNLSKGRLRRDTVAEPVEFFYPRRPWCPFGVIPPGDRLLSAWRRIR